MNLQFVQTHSGISALYEVWQNNSIVYKAEVPHNFIGIRANFIKNDAIIYALSFDLRKDKKNIVKRSTSRNLIPFNIYNKHQELIGSLSKKRTKAFWGYCYFELQLNQQLYKIYEVGCGKEGIKMPIYEGEKQIALIEKGTVVFDNKDTYNITAIDGTSAEIAALFNLYYDFIEYGNGGEYVSKSESVSYSYSLNKEEKSKYNSEFKNLVVKLDQSS